MILWLDSEELKMRDNGKQRRVVWAAVNFSSYSQRPRSNDSKMYLLLAIIAITYLLPSNTNIWSVVL